MAARVVLHVGAMKSGTSYLQSQLFTNQRALAERGVLVPGRAWHDQIKAVRDVLGHSWGAEENDGWWQRLREEIAAHDGVAVISMEFLGPATPEKIRWILDSLEDVTVVVTARDLNRSLAAMWQETVQNGRSWSFAEFLDGARSSRPRRGRRPEDVTEAGRLFWRQQNIVRLCRNWSQAGSRLVLLTVPPPGSPRDVLWERFTSVLGTDTAGLAPAPVANESIGAASAAVLHRLNVALETQGVAANAGYHLRKTLLAKQVLASRRSQEPRIGLPVDPWVVQHADQMVSQLQQLDLELVGEWGDLVPVDVPGSDPAGVSEAEINAAAIAGLAGLVAAQAESGATTA